jgi:hypothetical protein
MTHGASLPLANARPSSCSALEVQLAVRADDDQRAAVVRAVAAFYAEPI